MGHVHEWYLINCWVRSDGKIVELWGCDCSATKEVVHD